MTNRACISLVAAACLAASFTAGGCSRENGEAVQQPRPRFIKEPFGVMPDGRGVDQVMLRNAGGIEMTVLTYGGIIRTLRTPDRDGNLDDIVLGFDTAAPYADRSPYFGSLIGRYGNRIGGGRFTLDGTAYALATNDGANHLHGGVRGWDKVHWAAEPFQDARGLGVVLTYTSPDGEEGYPGTVQAKVTYTLNDANELIVDYEATTDMPTVINLTQHSYFNLAGSKATDILGHELTINAGHYTPVDAGLIPTGEIAAVDGTPFDFRQPTAIGARIGATDEQIARGKGYDHNWVLTRSGAGLVEAARVVEPVSGRTLIITTTEPGIQFYSGNFLDGTITGKGGRVYGHRAGFCLETQHYPDSPNKPGFPSTVLRPGEPYTSRTVFRF